MNVKKIISLIMLLFMLLPLGAQNSEGKQRYKIAACDWMMLKRQKIGSFQLMKELGGDGIEMDMGGLGNGILLIISSTSPISVNYLKKQHRNSILKFLLWRCPDSLDNLS